MKNLLTGILIIATLFLSSCQVDLSDKNNLLICEKKLGIDNTYNYTIKPHPHSVKKIYYNSKENYQVGDTLKIIKQ